MTPKAEAPSRHRVRSRVWPIVLVFVLALILRLLFWQATPDSSWPHSALYKGDAPSWVEQARAIADARPYEFDLPLRPPGAAYLIAFFWGDGGSIATLKLVWILLGAAAVGLLYRAAARDFGSTAGLVCGLVCAGSTGLMILSTSLNNETPYLVLVAGCMVCWAPLVRRPMRSLVAAWAALNAAACLMRVEHIGFCFLASAFAAVFWLRDRPRRQVFGHCTLGLLVFVIVLAPWHVQSWRAIQRFNNIERSLSPPVEVALQQVEQALVGIEWTEDAERLRAQLHAFCRRESASFVAATVAVRGRNRVTAADFGILDEAFGSIPAPLPARPFVTFYGGLNFYLANNPDAGVGFNRVPLERPPPLAGGARRYPQFLVSGLPPADLALSYPPHLEIVNRGWALGGKWLAGHPGEAFGRIIQRLTSFWRGAATGIGGANIPVGLSGRRGPADMVNPKSSSASAVWRLAWLVIAGYGLIIGLREDALAMVPWLVFLLSKVIAATAFFGYIRHGASVVPVMALFAGLAAVRLTQGGGWPRTRSIAPIAAATLLIVLEITRWLLGPQIMIDGRSIASGDPWPLDQHVERTVSVTW